MEITNISWQISLTQYAAQDDPFAAEKPNFTMNTPLVRAAQVLNVGSRTSIIDVKLLQQNTSSIIKNSVIEVIDTDSYLRTLDFIHPVLWLMNITLAKDCPSSNVLLLLDSNGVRLQVIRKIEPGEPLLMWFAECIRTLLNIPFLREINIKGPNVYMCHICANKFLHPNMLKLHLMLDCQRISSRYIWPFLADKIINISRLNLNWSASPLNLNTSVTQHFTEQNSGAFSMNTLASIPTEIITSHPPRKMDRFLRNSSSTSACADDSSVFCLSSSMALNGPLDLTPANDSPMIATSSQSEVNPEMNPVKMEKLVSYIGKLPNKRGYKCMYCNHVYSRKYGLRIHIRTHTGYKPLRCNICKRSFSDPSNFNKHERLHAIHESRYKCCMCNKILARKRDLERHIQAKHSDENRDRNGQ